MTNKKKTTKKTTKKASNKKTNKKTNKKNKGMKIKLNKIILNPNIQLIPVNTRKPRGPDKEPRVRGPNKQKKENDINIENLYPNLDDI